MIDTKELTYIGSFSVDSGQAMVGDPCYLDTWNTNRDDEWNIDGKEGQYSYHGAAATTIANQYGELGMSSAVVFSTGYGDGLYPVYAEINEDGRVARVVIEFVNEDEE